MTTQHIMLVQRSCVHFIHNDVNCIHVVHSDVISASYYVCPNTRVIFMTTLSYGYQLLNWNSLISQSIYQPVRYSC